MYLCCFSLSKINVLHAVNAKQVPSSQFCPIYLSNVLDTSNQPLIIQVWITLERFTLRFAKALKKDGKFLFTCLTTRTVHLEIVLSLDTSSCVMGIERFIARPGTSSTIWSDIGTNFVGAEKELLACITNWNGMAPTIFAHKGVASKLNPLHPIIAAPGSASSEAWIACIMIY